MAARNGVVASPRRAHHDAGMQRASRGSRVPEEQGGHASNKLPSPGSGFSLLEVLVALVLAAILALMVSRIMDTAVQSSEGVRRAEDESRRIITLRRLLHRDIQQLDWRQPVAATPESIVFTTRHHHLHGGPLALQVRWLVGNGSLIRQESAPALGYTREMSLWPRSDASLRIEAFHPTQRDWVPADAVLPRPGSPGAVRPVPVTAIPDALRFQVRFPNASGRFREGITCLERIPRALLPPR